MIYKEPSRIIILEGPSASGKSTVSEALEKRGWGSVHFQHISNGDRVAKWIQGIGEATALSKNGCVAVDRLHISGMVYGPLVRGEGLPEFDVWVITGWLMSRKAVIYYLPVYSYAEAVKRTNERYGEVISLRNVENAYERVLATQDLQWISDKNKNSDTLPDLIEINSMRKGDTVTDNGMGTPYPSTLR